MRFLNYFPKINSAHCAGLSIVRHKNMYYLNSKIGSTKVIINVDSTCHFESRHHTFCMLHSAQYFLHVNPWRSTFLHLVCLYKHALFME